MPYADYEKTKAKAREHYELNKDKLKARMLERYERLASIPSERIRILARLAYNRSVRLGFKGERAIISYLAKTPPTHCPVCDKKLDYTIGRGTGPRARVDSPSVDRKEPGLGYVVLNVWIICVECNGKKWEMTPEQYKARNGYIARPRKH